jgi:mannose-6-phosphate isomerase-like protein (cupin superfamily)
MKLYKLKDMTGGWFAGNFEPTLHKTDQFEVAVKKYEQGAHEKKHYHKQAKEFTVILNGRVKMNGIEYADGDIIEIEENEATDFTALTDVITVVLKTASVANDKFLV